MRRLAVITMCAAAALSCARVARIRSGNVTTGDLSDAAKVVNAIEDLRKDLTPENEYYVGRSVATNILAKHQYKYRDSDDIRAGKLAGLTLYVNEVGNVLAAAAMAAPRKGDRPSPIAGWHFTVVESDTLNAFAAPGGYIFITTGALAAAKNEDELACVLAHEIGHIVRGHALGTIKKSRYANVSKDALKASGAMSSEQLGQLTELLEGSIDDMIDAFFVKGYSRDTEFEADAVGVSIAAAAGYDPAAMVTYLETLKASQKTGSGGFYATHPKAEDRIAKLKGTIAKLGSPKNGPKVRQKRFVAAVAELR